MRNVAIVYRTDSAFTNDTCAAARSFAAEFGMQVVFDESYDPATMGQEQFDQMMRRARDSAQTLDVFIGCTFTDDSISITLAAHSVGLLPTRLTSLFLTVGPVGTCNAHQILASADDAASLTAALDGDRRL